MVSLIEISKTELYDAVRKSYEGDNIGLEKFHVERFTLDEAVKCTMDMINDASKLFEFSYFEIWGKGEMIGYSVLSGKLLYSFCINVKYRTKDIILQWWNMVKNILDNDFYTAVYENNKRAINFLKKRGMVLDRQNENLLIFKTK